MTMNKESILSLLEQIKKAQMSENGKLPRNSFYLDYDKVVCCERDVGESRYPYDTDGLMVWLHSTGFIDAIEGTFTVFKSAHFGEESAVSFFGGIKNGENAYTPVSITGASRPTDETGISRYILYSLRCAYCITETEDMIFTLRLHIDAEKHIHMSLFAINKSGEEKEFYIASFAEAILRYFEVETFWNKLTKHGKRYDNGAFILKSQNPGTYDSLVITSKLCEGELTEKYSTCARNDFLGIKGLSVANAAALKKGRFERESFNVTTTDLPIASDIMHFKAPAGGAVRIEYDLLVHHGNGIADAEQYINNEIDFKKIDAELAIAEQKEAAEFNNLKIRFEDWKTDAVNADTFSKFLRSVQKQITICAHGKNYAGPYIGMRDVFQQLEAALVWKKEISREKILNALNHVLITGRAPRQFSAAEESSSEVRVCLEKYIDQGVWIISTVYTYLAYTKDFDFLNTECGYLEVEDNDIIWQMAKRSPVRDSVLCHLKRITDYLLSTVDEEYGTGCLRVLFGDWNDAVDGLGATEDEGKKFGSGVTVMATLQFYQNLREMTEILKITGDSDGLCDKYAAASARIEEGLERHAIVTNDAGERRIVHGWGDKIGYKVGSYNDPDGRARYSLTSNSFWAITQFLRRDPTLKKSIMDCMNATSSKYGLKTFDVPFPVDAKGVGRIVNLTPGTYENSCAYAHGSLFGTMALFEMGEPKRAWEEILKTAVITHGNCTMTTFVMPNSYCENAEFGMDGESMGDWHTGSGSVIVKETIRYGFGIYPTLDGVRIQTPKYFPAKRGAISLRIKDSDLTLTYEDKGIGKRSVEIEGACGVIEKFDDLMDTNTYFLPADKMGEKVTIKVTD